MKLSVSSKRGNALAVAILFIRSYSSRALVCDTTSPLANTNNKVFVVNTCSQGIGHEFVRQLLHRSDKSARVIGLHRSLPDQLVSLRDQFSDRLSLVPIDIESQTSIDDAAKQIRSLTDRIDLLINTAGLLGDGKTVPGPERSLSQIDREWLDKTMQVYSICNLKKYFLFLLRLPYQYSFCLF